MKNTFKVMLIGSFVFLFNSWILNAQVRDSSSLKDLHTFNIYFINGYALSYDFYKSDKFYLRAELDISTNKSDIDDEGRSVYGSTTIDNNKIDGNRVNEYFYVGFSPQIIVPVFSTSFGQLYLGCGPSLGYSVRKSSYEEQRISDTGTSSGFTNSNNETYYDAGVLVIGGVKAFIADNISLFAEVHLNGGITWLKEENNNVSSNSISASIISSRSIESDGWFYDARFIRLGVSLSL
ncbi:MAG: hypothetical protein IPM56_10680 [Ignavibacteriales bacterium]|nr:MAG: hypothetical protein IPM56_10680 [Ignavibacteriales bacterium]